MRWLGMNNPASPTLRLNPGPIPGLPADHTHLRLMVPRVLVVEDEMTVALLIEDMVTELAYEVAAVVPRLDDAMRLLDSDSFDLALLDVHLNGKTVLNAQEARQGKELGVMRYVLHISLALAVIAGIVLYAIFFHH